MRERELRKQEKETEGMGDGEKGEGEESCQREKEYVNGGSVVVRERARDL